MSTETGWYLARKLLISGFILALGVCTFSIGAGLIDESSDLKVAAGLFAIGITFATLGLYGCWLINELRGRLKFEGRPKFLDLPPNHPI